MYGCAQTKQQIKSLGGFQKIVPFLFSEDLLTVAYALGAVQNTCMDIEYVAIMQQMGAVMRLQELLRSGDARLEQFAKGCLVNLRQTVMATRRPPEHLPTYTSSSSSH